MEEPKYFVSELLSIPIERFERRLSPSPGQRDDVASVETEQPRFLVVLPEGFGASSVFRTFKEARSVVLAVEAAVRKHREAGADSAYGTQQEVVGATARQTIDVWCPEDDERAFLAKEGFEQAVLTPDDTIEEAEASSSHTDSNELLRNPPGPIKSGL